MMDRGQSGRHAPGRTRQLGGHHGSFRNCGREDSRGEQGTGAQALAAWSGQKGQVWLDELKQCVSADMMKCRPNGKLTEAQLLERIDAFFNEVRG